MVNGFCVVECFEIVFFVICFYVVGIDVVEG